MLNRLYEKFDSISDELGVFKVIFSSSTVCNYLATWIEILLASKKVR